MLNISMKNRKKAYVIEISLEGTLIILKRWSGVTLWIFTLKLSLA